MRQRGFGKTTKHNHHGHIKIRETFSQGGEEQARKLLEDLLRGCVKAGLREAMQADVEALCGPRHQPMMGSPYHRVGSEQVVFYGPEGKA